MYEVQIVYTDKHTRTLSVNTAEEKALETITWYTDLLKGEETNIAGYRILKLHIDSHMLYDTESYKVKYFSDTGYPIPDGFYSAREVQQGKVYYYDNNGIRHTWTGYQWE